MDLKRISIRQKIMANTFITPQKVTIVLNEIGTVYSYTSLRQVINMEIENLLINVFCLD